MDVSAVLEIRRGGETSKYHITEPLVTVGRSADNRLVLDDEQVSRHHAKLEWSQGVLSITDLGSRNGTQVNNTKIGPGLALSLKDGDQIVIGNSTLTTRLIPAVEKKPSPRVEERAAQPVTAQVIAQLKKIRYSRGMLLAAIAGVVVVIGAIVAGVLFSAQAEAEIKMEAGKCLMNITDTGIADIDSEIINIDQQWLEAGEKLVALDQVVTPAKIWLDHQETVSRPGSWDVKVVPEVLEQLKNERYQVTELGVIDYPGQIIPEIEVTDLSTNQTYDWKTLQPLQDQLASLKNTLEQRREAKIKDRNTAIETINNALKYAAAWKTEKINKTTYTISGVGLGWAGKLTDGSWTYYQDKGEMVPRDMQAKDLEAILSAHR